MSIHMSQQHFQKLLRMKNNCRDFGVDANELATLAMRFLEEEYKDKKKSA